MNSAERESLKRLTEQLKALEANASPKSAAQSQEVRAQIAGYLMSCWLPADWGRRILMFGCIGVGIVGLITGILWLLLAWPLAIMFSPRAVGELIRLTR